MEELLSKFPNGKELYQESALFNKLIHHIFNRGISLEEALVVAIQENQNQQNLIKNLIDKLPLDKIEINHKTP